MQMQNNNMYLTKEEEAKKIREYHTKLYGSVITMIMMMICHD